ncbi:Penicillinase repressor [Syntrophobotulus glycolicus DSM 8271]|uniref:Penicillinase repressor n=1 Tax=Syntrophobotulus glycolicus (strain DSM 8271 / FlGlyR) TaxID=645991 RepID=F0T2S1_SYNGF|nr:BlaI/MecI/CopY family transcriptional regulator [Syntrophobotulus glycolicus]ADY56470.1 Penicillinase repressor [Syntrophobotulus glycolicus DSM 8271]
MSKQKNNSRLTEREMDILNILWSSDKPLVASDIAKMGNSLSINTVQAVLRNLLSKKLVGIADIVYSGTVLSRSYQATVSSREYTMRQLINQFQNLNESVSMPSIISTLLEYEKNEESVIEELEKMLKERKEKIKRKGQ